MKTRQSGFTLVEIAIVMVIIGLLLGGVLKGQELVENARIKRVVTDLQGVQAAYYGYMDRYKAISGDDLRATTRFSVTVVNGDGDGVLEGNWNSTTDTDESRIVWQHLRAAGLINGAVAYTQPTIELDNGLQIGFQNAPSGLTGTAICTSVPSKYASGIDQLMDDGVGTTGNMRGTAAAATKNLAAGTAAAYTTPVDGEYITLCWKI